MLSRMLRKNVAVRKVVQSEEHLLLYRWYCTDGQISERSAVYPTIKTPCSGGLELSKRALTRRALSRRALSRRALSRCELSRCELGRRALSWRALSWCELGRRAISRCELSRRALGWRALSRRAPSRTEIRLRRLLRLRPRTCPGWPDCSPRLDRGAPPVPP